MMVGYFWWWLPSGSGHGGNCCKCARFLLGIAYFSVCLVAAFWKYEWL